MPLQTIFFFGRLGDLLERRLDMNVPTLPATVAALRRELCQRYPHAASALAGPGVRACLDGMIVLDDAPIRAGQEIAFIPPLSGG